MKIMSMSTILLILSFIFSNTTVKAQDFISSRSLIRVNAIKGIEVRSGQSNYVMLPLRIGIVVDNINGLSSEFVISGQSNYQIALSIKESNTCEHIRLYSRWQYATSASNSGHKISNIGYFTDKLNSDGIAYVRGYVTRVEVDKEAKPGTYTFTNTITVNYNI
jgi:hypothetical protein